MEQVFAQILKEFLNENNLSRSEFARKVGVRPNQVSEWLYGKAEPGYKNLRSISKAFNISADYFLGLTDSY